MLLGGGIFMASCWGKGVFMATDGGLQNPALGSGEVQQRYRAVFMGDHALYYDLTLERARAQASLGEISYVPPSESTASLYALELGKLKEQRDAEVRAETLLLSWLSPAQLEEHTRYGFFDVIGNHTKRRYRITSANSYNVLELTKSGMTICRYCIALDDIATTKRHPTGDRMLAIKVSLETNEVDTLLKRANVQYIYGRFVTFYTRLFANWL